MIWGEDHQWRLDARKTPRAIGLLKEALRIAMGSELEAATDRKELARHFATSFNDGRLMAAIASARSEPGVAVSSEEFDADEALAGVANGVIDLTTMEHRPAQREDYVTRRLGAKYDPQALCPRWMQFLEDAFGDRPETIRYVQEVFGLILLGNRWRVMVVVYGASGTGKTVFLEVAHALAGDYGATANQHLLLKKGGFIDANRSSPALKALEGARLVTVTEISGGAVFDSAMVKDLTGGDTIHCPRQLQGQRRVHSKVPCDGAVEPQA